MSCWNHLTGGAGDHKTCLRRLSRERIWPHQPLSIKAHIIELSELLI